eukprot:m.1182811 g.1182811  ORF g.1182811 m.1182811 type:complete len:120 (-) comp24540_c1_seq5:3837-4196(-)
MSYYNHSSIHTFEECVPSSSFQGHLHGTLRSATFALKILISLYALEGNGNKSFHKDAALLLSIECHCCSFRLVFVSMTSLVPCCVVSFATAFLQESSPRNTQVHVCSRIEINAMHLRCH